MPLSDPSLPASSTALWRRGQTDPTIKPLWGAGVDDAHPLARDLGWFFALNEESGNTLSDLAGRSDAVLSGPVWTANGRGACLGFNNAGDIAMTPFCPFNPAAFSLVCWFRANGANQTHTLIRAAGGSSQGYATPTDLLMTVNHTYLSGGAANRALFGGQNPAGSGFSFIVGSRMVNDGQWHQVVGVRDGTSARLYVDGALDAQGAIGAIQATTRMSWGIGRYPVSSADNLTGNVEMAALYNRALTDEDAAQLFAAPYALLGSQAARRPVLPALLQRLLTETLALSEARGVGLLRALNEACGLLDMRGMLATRTLGDALGLSETLSRALNGSGQNLLRALAEVMAWNDTRAGISAKPLVDGLPLGDRRVLSLARQIGEALGFTDSAQALNVGMAVLTLVTSGASGDSLNRGGGKA